MKEAVEGYINGCTAKVQTPVGRLLVKAVLAGMMIAFGAAGSSVAAHNIANVGIARLVTGAVFPVGLMMVILTGAELFTGDCLMCMGTAAKNHKVWQLLKVLVLVYIGNLAGSVLVAAGVYFSGQLDYSNGLMGAYTIKIALGKCGLSFGSALISGILCNFLVCAAVMLAFCAKDVVGKLFSAFFLIYLFVVSGYEHSVANMYYIPAGLLAGLNSDYVDAAVEAYGYTSGQLAKLNPVNFLAGNLLPVTIGNIIGGMLAFGLPLWYIYFCERRAK